MIHLTPLEPARAPPSSPRTASSGLALRNPATMAASLVLSISVTMSVRLDLVSTWVRDRCRPSSNSAPAERARSTARRSMASWSTSPGSAIVNVYPDPVASGLVDLRSDTVTRPTPEMRRAMAEAEVGDDVYGEDPTVNALEEAFARRVGKQASVYVPSGVMGNQLALRVLAPAATTVVAGARQHVVVYEAGAAGRNAGVQFHTVADQDGTFGPDDVRWAIDAAQHHHPRPSLVCVENTHMPANGAPWPLQRLQQVAAVARSGGPAPWPAPWPSAGPVRSTPTGSRPTS